MMTAAVIAKGLGIEKIGINYLFSEKMGGQMFDKNPMTKLVVNQKDKDYVKENYLDGIDFEDSTHFKE